MTFRRDRVDLSTRAPQDNYIDRDSSVPAFTFRIIRGR